MKNNLENILCALFMGASISAGNADDEVSRLGQIVRDVKIESYQDKYNYYNHISNSLALINAHLLRDSLLMNNDPEYIDNVNMKVEFALCAMDAEISHVPSLQD